MNSISLYNTLVVILVVYSQLLYATPLKKQHLFDNTIEKQSKQFTYSSDELTQDYWNNLGGQTLRRALNQQTFNTKAKNVILFLGDGMSVATLTAARILKGQLADKSGEESILAFENFPHVSLVKTYNVDHQVPDSAGTGTAFMCGVKTNMAVLGVNARITTSERNCTFIRENSVPSFLKRAIEAGKSAGVVTTTRITHATPGAGYAHTPNRDWEASVASDVIGDCKDIARQLVEDEPGIDLKVILGGGRRYFLPTTALDYNGVNYGQRTDGRNLINQWLEQKRNNSNLNPNEYTFVNSTGGLNDVNYNDINYLFGLFNYDHLTYDIERDTTANGEPSIMEMTNAAIHVLRKNSNGFVLLVEGGRIDHAHHDNYGKQSLYETLAFEKAIQSAMDLLPEDENTIVVTADHAHTFTINGYPNRGNNIFGVAANDSDSIPYTTLMYGNGPGFVRYPRPNPEILDTGSLTYRQLSAAPLSSSAHSGEDVAIHSRGPMSHLFQGTQEQSYVAHVISFAACIGNYQNEDHCISTENPNSSTTVNLNSSTTEYLISSTTEIPNSSSTIYSLYIIVYLFLDFICSIIF